MEIGAICVNMEANYRSERSDFRLLFLTLRDFLFNRRPCILNLLRYSK
jgi:hypothetical protein